LRRRSLRWRRAVRLALVAFTISQIARSYKTPEGSRLNLEDGDD